MKRNNITKHGYKRLKERVGVKGDKKSEQFIVDIWEKGKRISDFDGRKEKYLEKVLKSHNQLNDREVRVSGNSIYVFSDAGILITTFDFTSSVIGKKRSPRDWRFSTDESFM